MSENLVGPCGLYCGWCPFYVFGSKEFPCKSCWTREKCEIRDCGMKMHIPNMAKELKPFVNAYRYGECIGYVTKDFKFENFMKGLNWFANSSCTGCLQGGGMPKNVKSETAAKKKA